MFRYFDYIFFRIYSFYVVKKDSNPLIMTFNFIGILQLSILFATTLLLEKFTNWFISSIDKDRYWIFITIITMVLYSINMIRYLPKKYYLALARSNSDNPFNKKIKTWMIFIQPLIFIFLIILLLSLTKGSNK